MTKTCTGCGIDKPLDEDNFYMADRQRGYWKSKCRTCHKADMLARYHNDPLPKLEYRRRYYQANRAKVIEQSTAWGLANPERKRAHARARVRTTDERWEQRLWEHYKLTVDDYYNILDAQGGGCGICGTLDPDFWHGRFNVDHNHACCPGSRSCGFCVRGLLCHCCNSGIGHLRDDIRVLTLATNYLERTRDYRA